MTFTLTDSLINEIVSALENQETKFLLDAETLQFVDSKTAAKDLMDKYYELPEWSSSDGFKIREDFVSKLTYSEVKSELKEVLHSGRGVFRNFRNVLKNYPEVEKRWHLYKNRIMHSYINEWYNGLREIWGLEKLDYFPESDENLIHDDFSFRKYNSITDKDCIILHVNETFYSEQQSLPDVLHSALFEMWKSQFEYADTFDQTGFFCQTMTEDFAGCITASLVQNTQEQVYKITSLFVPVHFRGLGIGTELISMCLLELKKCGAKFILMPEIIVPDFIEPLLLRNGFEKIGSGFAAKMQ